VQLDAVAVLGHDLGDRPGPTCALAPPTLASAFDGGGRLESTRAATTR
jgi:hypothetical protein